MSLNQSAIGSVEYISRPGGQAISKRILDMSAASLIMLVLSPVLVGVALLILVVDRQNPFYLDERVGLRGRLFRCWKFRTMRSDPAILEAYFAANPGEREQYRLTRKLTNDPRKTAVGSFLRRTSIDEFPQLVNVVRGEMSLVGPRPITEGEFLQRPDGDQAWMASVRPGMTGLWQVSGRCDLGDERRVELDSNYARDWSMALDLQILVRTPIAVLTARGAR